MSISSNLLCSRLSRFLNYKNTWEEILISLSKGPLKQCWYWVIVLHLLNTYCDFESMLLSFKIFNLWRITFCIAFIMNTTTASQLLISMSSSKCSTIENRFRRWAIRLKSCLFFVENRDADLNSTVWNHFWWICCDISKKPSSFWVYVTYSMNRNMKTLFENLKIVKWTTNLAVEVGRQEYQTPNS